MTDLLTHSQTSGTKYIDSLKMDKHQYYKQGHKTREPDHSLSTFPQDFEEEINKDNNANPIEYL